MAAASNVQASEETAEAASPVPGTSDDAALSNFHFHVYVKYLQRSSPDAADFRSKLLAVQKHYQQKGGPKQHGGLAQKSIDKIKAIERKLAAPEAVHAMQELVAEPARKRHRTAAEREVDDKVKALCLHYKTAPAAFKKAMEAKQEHKSMADLKRKIKQCWPDFVTYAKQKLTMQPAPDHTFQTLWVEYSLSS